MDGNYYQKYLKYKTKYLTLKKIIGGGIGKCTFNDSISSRTNGCGCPEFSSNITQPELNTLCTTNYRKQIKAGPRQKAGFRNTICNHEYKHHVQL
jgi:hypothetical protein